MNAGRLSLYEVARDLRSQITVLEAELAAVTRDRDRLRDEAAWREQQCWKEHASA